MEDDLIVYLFDWACYVFQILMFTKMSSICKTCTKFVITCSLQTLTTWWSNLDILNVKNNILFEYVICSIRRCTLRFRVKDTFCLRSLTTTVSPHLGCGACILLRRPLATPAVRLRTWPARGMAKGAWIDRWFVYCRVAEILFVYSYTCTRI